MRLAVSEIITFVCPENQTLYLKCRFKNKAYLAPEFSMRSVDSDHLVKLLYFIKEKLRHRLISILVR